MLLEMWGKAEHACSGQHISHDSNILFGVQSETARDNIHTCCNISGGLLAETKALIHILCTSHSQRKTSVSTCKVGAGTQSALHSSHSDVKSLFGNHSRDIFAAAVEQQMLIDAC